MQLKVNSELNVDSHAAVPVFFPKYRAEFEGQMVSDSRNRGIARQFEAIYERRQGWASQS